MGREWSNPLVRFIRITAAEIVSRSPRWSVNNTNCENCDPENRLINLNDCAGIMKRFQAGSLPRGDVFISTINHLHLYRKSSGGPSHSHSLEPVLANDILHPSDNLERLPPISYFQSSPFPALSLIILSFKLRPRGTIARHVNKTRPILHKNAPWPVSLVQILPPQNSSRPSF